MTSSATAGLLPVSQMVADTSVLRLDRGSQCSVTTLRLQDGADLVYWSSRFEEKQDIPLQDDSDRVHFSFNSQLQGGATCRFDTLQGGRAYTLAGGFGNISYGPGRRGHYCQQGLLNNLTVMVHPDVLSAWTHDMDTGLGEALRSGACFLQGHHGAELHRTAICLAGSLNATTEGHGTPSRHSLWIRAQSLALVGLFLESRGRQETSMSAAMQKRMARVHDRLLSDLSCAPTLLELAVEAGTSVPTLARAFRRQYGQSVYSLFQQERMQHARTQLLRGQFSVMHVATDLGYSNASHFAAAFRKHFGVNPSAVRESRRGGAQRRPGSPR